MKNKENNQKNLSKNYLKLRLATAARTGWSKQENSVRQSLKGIGKWWNLIWWMSTKVLDDLNLTTYLLHFVWIIQIKRDKEAFSFISWFIISFINNWLSHPCNVFAAFMLALFQWNVRSYFFPWGLLTHIWVTILIVYRFLLICFSSFICFCFLLSQKLLILLSTFFLSFLFFFIFFILNLK